MDEFLRVQVRLHRTEDRDLCEELASLHGKARGRRVRALLRAGAAAVRGEAPSGAANPRTSRHAAVVLPERQHAPSTEAVGRVSGPESSDRYDAFDLDSGQFNFTQNDSA